MPSEVPKLSTLPWRTSPGGPVHLSIVLGRPVDNRLQRSFEEMHLLLRNLTKQNGFGTKKKVTLLDTTILYYTTVYPA